jgi:hypothetical protein
MSCACVILIQVCTHLSNGKHEVALEWDPHHIRHSKFLMQNYFSYFQVSTCILTMSWRYSIHFFSWKNMLIHRVFTFLNNLLPLVLKRSTNFWNFAKFFEMWIEKEYKLCRIPPTWCIKGRFDKVNVSFVGKMVNVNKKRWRQNCHFMTNLIRLQVDKWLKIT